MFMFMYVGWGLIYNFFHIIPGRNIWFIIYVIITIKI